MKKSSNQIIKYLVTTCVGGLMAVLVLWLRDFSLSLPLYDKYKIIADAFTVPGVCLIMLGLLVWASTEGAFDFLGYAASRIGDMLLPGHGAVSKHETYYQYVERKRGERAKGFWFITFVGFGFLAVAIVFVLLCQTV